jgi:hypothetical protein
MIELLMILSLSPMTSQPNLLAQVQPCVWPNPCGVQEETVEAAAEYEICVYPRKCGGKNQEETVQAAQVQPCVWPNPCGVTDGKESALI